MTPWESLTNAIVLQAVKDYRDSLKKLSHGRKNEKAEFMKDECERFFRSQWFSELTTVDGEMILRKLKEEVAGA